MILPMSEVSGSQGPLVAVIVPVYGVEDYVVAALESVRDQEYQDWECIVIDDGSPDASVERAMTVIAAEPRMRLVRQRNLGVAAARNTGLAHLSPSVRFVAYLDSDDLWLPGTLRVLVEALDDDDVAVGSWGYAELCGPAGDPVHPGRHSSRQRDRRRINGWRLESVPAEESLTFEEAVVVSPLWPPGVAVHRRPVVDAVGPFDVSLRQTEDWDYYQRMLRRGHYRVVQEQVAWYRQHGDQVTVRELENTFYREKVRRKVWASSENTPAQRRSASRAWRQLQARQTVRSTRRLVGALRHHRWRDVVPLFAGTAVLAAQNFAGGPPRVSERQLRWSRRGT